MLMQSGDMPSAIGRQAIAVPIAEPSKLMWTAFSGGRDQSGGVVEQSCCHAGGMSELEFDERPWGTYQVLEDADSHKVKRIRVTPGHRLSYQRHQERAEHWYVVAGEATVTLDGVDHVLGPAQAIDIPRGSAHRVANHGTEPLTFIEVQVGDYFGEDDIERLEDDYGRGREGNTRNEGAN